MADSSSEDGVSELNQQEAAAVEKARSLGSMPREAFATIKRNRIEEIESRVLEQFDEKVELFLEQWYSPQTRKRLKEAMSKF